MTATDEPAAEQARSAAQPVGEPGAPGAEPPDRPVRVLEVPELALVVLVGASGSGKSTFARRVFRPTQVLSSDAFRAMVADDENDQSATAAAFEALYLVAARRLAGGRLTVIDATNVQPDARAGLVELARAHDVLPVAIVLDIPARVCVERSRLRADRDIPAAVVRRQHDQLRRSVRQLAAEGFRSAEVLHGAEEVSAAVVVLRPLPTDLRARAGPFDVIGDVHGCRAELTDLLATLGYRLARDAADRPIGAHHPDGRTAVFLGDLVDRGPDTPGVLRLVMEMVAAGNALAVAGNHDAKLARALHGNPVRNSAGLTRALDQLDAEPPEFTTAVVGFLDGLISHYVLDGGRLVVAHAGLIEAYHNRASHRVWEFALYGPTTGETDEFGRPVRLPWARDYHGRATVLHGHTPVARPEWLNETICLDTGCVFGGRLTALRWPERELVSVPARAVWQEPVRPIGTTSPAGAAATADAGTPALGAAGAAEAGAAEVAAAGEMGGPGAAQTPTPGTGSPQTGPAGEAGTVDRRF